MNFNYRLGRYSKAIQLEIGQSTAAQRGHKVKTSRLLTQLLASGSALVALATGGSAFAGGTYTIGGGTPVTFDSTTDPLFGNLLANVNKSITVNSNHSTGIINWTYAGATNASVTVDAGVTIAPSTNYNPGIGGAYGVEVWAWTARVDVNHNGRVVQNFGNGIDLISGYSGFVPGSDVVLRGTGSVDAGFIGVEMATNVGNIDYSLTGAIRSGGAGIYAYSIGGGNVTLNGGGTGTINASNSIAGQEGIDVRTNGAINVRNFASITGAGTGLYFNSAAGAFSVVNSTGAPTIMGAGNINVSGVGPITSTTEWGVYAATTTGSQTYVMTGPINAHTSGIAAYSTSGGALNITTNGAVTTNGALSVGLSNSLLNAGGHGIYASTFNGGGNIVITNNAAVRSNSTVLGTAGITSVNGSGTSVVNANANVTGANAGIYTVSGGGVSTVNVAGGVQVYGNSYGVFNQGGNHVTNNAGLITTTANVGLTLGSTGPSQTSGLFAYSAWGAVSSTVNNTGTITGGLYSDTGATTINNRASGVMNLLAGFANQTTTGMTINNLGLVNSYAGATTLLGNRFNNQSGGIIDLTLNGAVTDTLTVQNFSAQTGSRLRLNLDVNTALGIQDRGTTGNADTILVVAGASTPQAGSFIDFTQTGGDANALTGSVALVYTGVVLAAPTAGTQLVQSTNYLFGTLNPSTRARIYKIVDDNQGGAYLQWVPNISTATMGAFAGGDLSSKQGKGGAMGLARGSVSGAYSAASAIAGQSADGAGGGAGGSCTASNRDRYAWGQIQSSTSSYDGGGEGRDVNGVIGFDAKLRTTGKNECGRTSAGVFLYGNRGKNTHVDGAVDSDGYGAGIYIRTLRESGLYAQLMGTAGFVENDILNRVFRTTAQSRARNFLVDGTVGYVRPIRETLKTKLDLRGSISMLDSKSNPVADSFGFLTTNTSSDVLVGQATIGLLHRTENGSSGYVRLGGRYTDITSKTVAYGIVVNTAGDEWGGVAEAGLRLRLGAGGEFHLGAFGDFSDSTTGFGGRLGLRYAW